MSSIPNWILNEAQCSTLNSSNILPRIKNSSNLRGHRKPLPQLIAYNRVNFRNSSVIQRPLNPLPCDSKFKQQCENLWSKFDSAVSPALQKYSKINLCKPNKLKANIKLKKLSDFWNKDFVTRNKVIKCKNRYSDCSGYNSGDNSGEASGDFSGDNNDEVVENDFGVQCDISSESSEIDIKIPISRYNHYKLQ